MKRGRRPRNKFFGYIQKALYSIFLMLLIVESINLYHYKKQIRELQATIHILKNAENQLRNKNDTLQKEIAELQEVIRLSEYYTYIARAIGESHEVSVPLVKSIIENLAKNNPYNYTPSEILSLILAESGFNRKAISSVGARGLMQIMPKTAKAFGVEDSNLLFDPLKNVELGITILNRYTELSGGDKMLGLLKYNRGPTKVEDLQKKGENPFNAYPYKVKKYGG